MDLQTVKTTAIYVLIGIAVAGLLLAILIKKVIGKIISLVLAAVLIIAGWQQRGKVIDYANSVKGKTCATSTHYFGVEVKLPASWCQKT